MAKTTAQFFGNLPRLTDFGFASTQRNIFRGFVLESPDVDVVKFNRKEYIFELDDSVTTFRFTIAGKLNTDLPFEERTIGRVQYEQFDNLTGELFAGATYKNIKNLDLSQFLDINFNSFGQSFNGNDEITGVDNVSAILTGLRGNDKLFVRSRNSAIGGPGKDKFFFSKDTRGANILDFNVKKDKLFIEDDLGSNYRLANSFGQVRLENLEGDVIAYINNFNDSGSLPEVQINDLL